VEPATNKSIAVRPAIGSDDEAIWHILKPTFRAGETYPIPCNISRADALAYWCAPGHEVFVAQEDNLILGTYYLRANNRGGGAHVANCGYMVASDAMGRGAARASSACGFGSGLAALRTFKGVEAFGITSLTSERLPGSRRGCQSRGLVRRQVRLPERSHNAGCGNVGSLRTG
jgi:hypothetical protein